MNTEQADLKIDGVGKINGGAYNQIKIDGVASIDGDLSFHTMNVNGTCNTKGDLSGDYLNVDGLLKTSGDMKAKEFCVNGLAKSGNGKIYADKIVVDGMLKNDGEVNADNIEIDGGVTLNDLFGDKISINSDTNIHIFHKFIPFKSRNLTTVCNIECSKLIASRVTCQTISATDIHLSSNCVVEKITCSGRLVYDSTCVIGKIEGDCEIVND